MKLQVLAMGLLLATAGCLGGDDGDDTGTGDGVEPQDTDGDGEPDVPDAPETPPEITWSSETREGSVTTINAVVAQSNPLDADDTAQIFAVAEGAVRLVVNFTASGGEVNLLVGEPGCEFNAGCEEVVPTSGGTARIDVESPEAGDWFVRVFGSAPGVSQISYQVVIAQAIGAPPPAEQ